MSSTLVDGAVTQKFQPDIIKRSVDHVVDKNSGRNTSNTNPTKLLLCHKVASKSRSVLPEVLVKILVVPLLTSSVAQSE